MAHKSESKGCLSLIFPFLFSSSHDDKTSAQDRELTSKPLPYRLRDDFLSPAEFSFYKVLESLIGLRLTIQSKVRLADIFFVSRPNENLKYLSKISQKHLDFLVCNSVTMKPLFAIELDDSSHGQNNRQKRDFFVESVCEVAGFPLVRFPVQREYSIREIAAQIAPYIREITGNSPPPQPDSSNQESLIPVCPKCGLPMVVRIASHGDHMGKQFFGCQNFPQCRETKSFTE